jgi:hypothetical protein
VAKYLYIGYIYNLYVIKKMEYRQEIKTMADQINARELRFAKFQLLADNEKIQVTVMKGQKFIEIRYDEASDLYVVQKGKIKKFDVIKEKAVSGVYADQLQGMIQEYFPRFEYVMDSIRIAGVNC